MENASKRTGTRKIVRTQAFIVFDSGAILPAKTVDVSDGGMALIVEKQIPNNVIAEIKFQLMVYGKKYTVSVKSKIIYCVYGGEGFKLGIQYLSMADQDKTVLVKFLAQ